MPETIVLKAHKRDHMGSRASRKLREKGLLPAIVYGHKEEPVSIQLDYHDFAMEMQHHHRLLAVDLDGQEQRFLVKTVQFDHLGDKIVHVDLTRVDLHERVKVNVPIELKGAPKTATEGAVVDQMMMQVELECVVTDIPERIRLPIAELEVGQTITAGQLPLPEGVTLVTSAEAGVVTLRIMAEEVPTAAPVVEGEAAEPEVIAREKPAEEKEGEEKK
jgi:large subunit ribosomal protein L25